MQKNTKIVFNHVFVKTKGDHQINENSTGKTLVLQCDKLDKESRVKREIERL